MLTQPKGSARQWFVQERKSKRKRVGVKRNKLSIQHAFQIHDKESDIVQEILCAKLGNLTTLEVADHIQLCGAIMGAIQTPSLTCLEIEGTHFGEDMCPPVDTTHLV